MEKLKKNKTSMHCHKKLKILFVEKYIPELMLKG